MNTGLFLSLLFMIMMVAFYFILFNYSFIITVSIYNFLYLNVVFDFFSIMFFFVLLTMVFSVLFFSSYYMTNDTYSYSFYLSYTTFMLSMMMLMFVPDFFFFFVGWDGLGLTSFLLIMYYQSSDSWYSGFKTFLMKRFGDGLLLLILSLIIYNGYLNFCKFKDYLILFMSIMFLFGLSTKSCIYPFNSWLPMAMAAPTPVSALVHSSTLVTAGLYLFMRKWFMFSSFSYLIMVLGVMTTLMGSFCSMYDWDFKKIMAYSTLSQLGLMLVILSCGEYSLCFYHLMSHACFKALLFIMSGMFMYKINHDQDMRLFCNKIYFSPMISMILLFCLFSLSGLFFFSGFYSKDSFLILFGSFSNMTFNLFYLCMVVLTLIYSFRIMLYLSSKSFTFMFKNSFFYSSLELLPLTFLSVFFSFMINNLFFIYSFVNSYYLMFYLFLVASMMYFMSFNYFYFYNWYINSGFYSKFFKSSIYNLYSCYSKLIYINYESMIFSSINNWGVLTKNFNTMINLFSFKYFMYWSLFIMLFMVITSMI